MRHQHQCPDCGATLPADAPRGLCPECLMGAALPRASTGGSAATGGFEPAGQGVLATIAQSIGPVPRVLLRDTAAGEEPGPIVRPAGDDDHDRTIRYRIDGEIARGGMGAVLKGRDPDLGRDVALKVLRDDLRDRADMVRRFVEEAQIGGQLQHPGVVPIYELGTFADRRPFFAMKLVKGHTLAQLLEGRESPDDDRPRFLAIFEAIAQTVAFAHARGVIHRDLKPSNVMVGSFGEVQVMDWGLAKVLRRGGVADDEKAGKLERQETVIATARSGSDAPGLSHAGSVMGTPAYMAPEQARGEIDQVDERADVFALGSILCEVLSGEPAFLGRSSGEILRKAGLGDTADALARLDACGADAELIAIARDCLAREPEDRPREAGVVARRVTTHLAGVQDRLRAAEVARAAESARAEEAIVRARAERRARQFQVGLAASLLLLTTVGGLTFTYWLQQRQQREARFAQVLAEATALRDKAGREAGDPAAWRDALAALERAVGQGPAEQVEALRREIQAGLDGAERDATLRQALVEVRANKQDVGPEGTDAAYATAFRAAKLDLEALEPAELAQRLRRRREMVAIELSAFLDDWSAVRREAKRPVAAWRKPLEAARLADPEPYRDRLRGILLAEDPRPQVEALRALAAAREAAELPAPTAVLLGNILAVLGQAEAAAALLRPAAVRHPGDVWVNYYLAAALDRRRPAAREEAVRYYTAARALRPETAHELAHLLERLGRGGEAEAVFRDLTDRRPVYARHLACLGIHLKDRGRAADAAPIFERAVAAARETARLKPDDAGAHSYLGLALHGQGKADEAIAEYRAAIRLQPDYARAHSSLGAALCAQGKLDEAVAEFRAAIRLEPDNVVTRSNLGVALRDQGKLDEAIAEYRAAIRLKPDDALAHNNLGDVLRAQGKPDEATAEYRAALRLQPDYAEAHFNLGVALHVQGKVDEAIAALREALRLRPDDAQAHTNLGVALRSQEKLDEAIAEHRAALRLQPDYALAHYNLGLALSGQGKAEEAIAEYRAAIQLKPDYPEAHNNLGLDLSAQGKADAAIAAYREAIRLKPDLFEAHFNLGHLLRGRGDYAGSLAMFRKGHEVGSQQPGWRYPSALWVAEAERMAALAPRLPAFLKGEDSPRDVGERLALAQMCYGTRWFAASARFWTEAFAADPKLGDDRGAGHRFNAACAAALAGAGQGTADPKPDDAARARLRGQALDWLKADRAAWATVLDAGDAQARPIVRQKLQHWQSDPDLASVRDRDALAKLPADERRDWEALWKDVDALLTSAARPGPAGSKPSETAVTRPGEARAGSKPSTPLQGPLAPATPGPDGKPDTLEALASLHTRAHELAPSKPNEAEPLFRQALEGYRKAQGPDGDLILELTLDLANLMYQSGRGADAEPLFRAALKQFRERFGPADPGTAGILAPLGLSLIQQAKWTEAEPVLRESLAIREQVQPDEWTTFNTRSLLGGSLLGQRRYAEAEPLIVSGYEGMKAREAKIPPPGKPRFTEGAERVVRLYEDWGKKEKAAEWRAKLAKSTDGIRKEP